jgi:hypothetical protein
LSSYGAGNGTIIGDDRARDVMFPELDFLTNDSWALVRALADGRGYPLLFMDRYSKGIIYIWTIPDNFNDLYRLPVEVTSALKNYLMRGFPVRVDASAQVALFAYDNNSFIVESYLPAATDVRIFIAGSATKLRNIVTGEILTGQPGNAGGRGRRGGEGAEPRMTFNTHLPPHSYAVFSVEK